ncbi:transposase [Tabrizicola sp.]|uniref:transposase n=1 Tax=Tabrizicola sp. TaxID=2005166 RepID=UPI0035231A1F
MTPDQLSADAGLGPVTRQSGKSRGVSFRWACNRRLRTALTCFADNSRHACAWAARIYSSARGRGCRHPHAIRIIGRAWLRILWRSWQDRRPYDPVLHGAASHRLTQAISCLRKVTVARSPCRYRQITRGPWSLCD